MDGPGRTRATGYYRHPAQSQDRRNPRRHPGGRESFAPHWSAKIEYDYVDLGTTTENFNTVVAPATLTLPQDIHHTLQLVKLGANYRF
jgi:hypothetical protein